MKKLLLSLTAFLVALSLPLGAASQTSSDVEPIIVKTQTPVGSPNFPRMPAAFHIAAWVDDAAPCVGVYLNAAGSSVSIQIENNTTGETFAYTVGGTGTWILPISGSAGDWEITFTLDCGNVFVGEFTL